MIEAHWEGLDELAADCDAAVADIPMSIGEAVMTATHKTRDEVIAAVGGHPKVTKGIKEKITGTGVATVGRVRATGKAGLMARGARPHEIAPRKRRALMFAGRWAANATSPGFRPWDFMEQGARATERVADEALDLAGIRIEQRYTRGRRRRA